ncbi:hypothetical protein AB832_02235 [Flavobacteriaceae bacterium (ex Bugula neritina AB1)]|nr:hypothetical protein AB832_02235 [Flavobacteriaceae bacterium (ex Bugula neritina AB1)]
MKKENPHINKTKFNVPENYFETFEEKLFEKMTLSKDSNLILDDTIKSGLKTPDNYFETFEDQLLENINPEAKKSTLRVNGVKTGFTTPNDYFEQVEQTILKKTTIFNKEPKVISLFSRKNILFISGIAAMVAIVISLAIPLKSGVSDEIINLELADIQEYLTDENVDFNDSEIAALFSEELNFTETFNAEDISDETLFDYLSNEDIENETIYIE